MSHIHQPSGSHSYLFTCCPVCSFSPLPQPPPRPRPPSSHVVIATASSLGSQLPPPPSLIHSPRCSHRGHFQNLQRFFFLKVLQRLPATLRVTLRVGSKRLTFMVPMAPRGLAAAPPASSHHRPLHIAAAPCSLLNTVPLVYQHLPFSRPQGLPSPSLYPNDQLLLQQPTRPYQTPVTLWSELPVFPQALCSVQARTTSNLFSTQHTAGAYSTLSDK